MIDRQVSATRTWLPLVLIVWGLPAFMLWFTIGVFADWGHRRDLRLAADRLDNLLARVRLEAEPTRWLTEVLQARLAAGPAAIGADPDDPAAWTGWLTRDLPPGLFTAFWFDRHGRPCGVASDVEAFADFANAAIDPLGFPRLASATAAALGWHFAAPGAVLVNVRGRPGHLALNVGGDRWTWAGFFEVPASASRRLGRGLLFVHRRSLPTDRLLDRVVARIGTVSAALGLRLGASAIQWGDGDPALRRRVAARLEPGGIGYGIGGYEPRAMRRRHVSVGDENTSGVVEGGCPVGDGGLAVAVERVAPARIGWHWLVALLYLAGSVLVLRRSWQVLVAGRPWRAPLAMRIAFFLGLAIGVPGLCSAALVWMTALEEREAAWQTFRGAVLGRLAAVDAGGADAWHRHRRLIQREVSRLERGRAPLSVCQTRLARLVDLEIADDVAMTATGGPVMWAWEAHPYLVRQALKVPRSARWSLLASWIEREAPVSPEAVRALLASGSAADPAPVGRLPGVESEAGVLAPDRPPWAGPAWFRRSIDIAPMLRVFATVLLQPENRMAELATALSDDPEVALDVLRLMATDWVSLSGFGMATRGLLETPRLGQQGVPHVVFLLLHGETVISQYLQRVCAVRGGLPPAVELQVLGPGPFGFNHPHPDQYRRQSAVIQALQGRSELATPDWVEAPGTALVAWRCTELLDQLLVATAPRAAIEAGADRRFRARLRRLGWVTVGGLGLLAIMWGVLLAPVGALQAGLAAMRERRFDHDLPPLGDDELGRLAGAFAAALRRLPDFELARRLQQVILPPRQVEIAGWNILSYSCMLQDVGGDFFDVVPMTDGRLTLAMGDVSGHGIAAALVTTMAKAAVQLLPAQYPSEPLAALTALNRNLVRRLRKARMMTMSLIYLDPVTGRCQLVNGGQTWPLRLRPDRSWDFVETTGMPLGVSARARWVPAGFSLAEEVLVLYSDGLTEVTNEQGEAVGYQNFGHLVVESIFEGEMADAAARIFARIRRFAGAAPPNDDATVVVAVPPWFRWPPPKASGRPTEPGEAR